MRWSTIIINLIMRNISFALSSLAAVLILFSCNKNKETEAAAIAFESESLDMAVGETRKLEVFLSSGKADINDVEWSSDAPSVVEVSDNGSATALKEGTAVITARYGNEEAVCKITVTIPVEKIEFPTQSVSLPVDRVMKASVTIQPSNATLRKRIVWENTNPYVARTMEIPDDPSSIWITAQELGNTTITAKCGGKEARLYVYVDAVQVTSVTVSPTSVSLKAGETRQLSASVTPSNATNKTVSWESSDPKIATVKDGLVTAERAGTARIWAYCGAQKASCMVTVSLPDGAVDLGLSVYWASSNLGTTNNFNPGGYYAWGEVSPKSTFTWNNYQLRVSGDSEGNIVLKRYNFNTGHGTVDRKGYLSDYDYMDDPARQTLGGNWRVPTMKEFRELAENCTLYWATLPSLGTVMQFTSKVPGYTDRSIILPVGGFKDDTPGITPTQSSGQYWTSQINTAYSWDAHMVRVYYHQNTPKFDDSGIHKRFRGLNIRPVW